MVEGGHRRVGLAELTIDECAERVGLFEQSVTTGDTIGVERLRDEVGELTERLIGNPSDKAAGLRERLHRLTNHLSADSSTGSMTTGEHSEA